MPIAVQCPNCSARLNAPDAAAGKRVKCPKCQTPILIPAAAEYEVVEDKPAPPPVKANPRPVDDEDDRPARKRRAEDEDEDERPKKRSRRRDDEDDDDRDDRARKRSRRDDEDEDERPSRRRSRRDDDEDEDDDRPRRRSGRGYGSAKKMNVCGLIGLILGIPSILITFFACCGGWIPGIIGGAASLALGITGLMLAKKSEGQMGGGLAVASTILGGIAVVLSLLWGLLLAAMFGLAGTLPTTPAPSLTTPADYTLTAVQLDTDYENNVVAADAKYKGKIVEVTGKVERVSDVIRRGRMTVELTGSFDGSTVDCDFGSSTKSDLAGVAVGSTVTIRGKCAGRKTVDGDKYVTLEQCVVVPPGSTTKPPGGTKPTEPGKAPDGGGDTTKPVSPTDRVGATLTAAQFADEFKTNAADADAKYSGMVVQLSGEVAEVWPMDVGDTRLVLEGKAGSRVNCVFGPGRKTAVAGLHLGSFVTVWGRYAGHSAGEPKLTGCITIGGPQPEPATLKVTADALAKEFRADPKAANAKYHGKVVELTGVSAAVTTNPDGQTIINMNPNAAFGCSVVDADVPAAKKLKPGATVTVRGTCEDDGTGVVRFLNCTLVK